jgi:hypothetical protein
MALEKVDLYCSPWAGLQPKNFGDIVETEGVEIAK